MTFARFNKALAVASIALGTSLLAIGAEANTRTFPAGKKASIEGVIVSRSGDTLTLKADDNSIGTVELSSATQIALKRPLGNRTPMSGGALTVGLRIQARGKGNENGALAARRVLLDAYSLRAAHQIDARVSPLEARTTTVEDRANTLESRAAQMEQKQGALEETQNQITQHVNAMQAEVAQVRTEADQANQGVAGVTFRVNNLDNYQPVATTAVYFKTNSSVLSLQGKQELDALAETALAQKAYVIVVAGFADTTGKSKHNQRLSEARADVVRQYLEQHGNIPIPRIVTPTGMGTSNPAAPNDSAEGRKLNRRVQLTVLVNQGVVGGAHPTEASTGTAAGEVATR